MRPPLVFRKLNYVIFLPQHPPPNRKACMTADSSKQDKLLEDITALLVKEYGCHTVILYGSRARDESDSTSDYDIVAIRNEGGVEKDCRMLGNTYLDAFIYSDAYIKQPDEFLIRIRNGRVLKQKDSVGDVLLTQVQEIYDNGPQKTPAWEKQEIRIWLPKMLARAERDDIEGNFRRHWLLQESLSSYFRLHDLWYLGPKESFAWLKYNDPKVYTAFNSALKVDADTSIIRMLVDLIVDNPASV
jgi:predicted nucleotidyltransferase